MIRRLRRHHLVWSWVLAGASTVALITAVLAPTVTHRTNPALPGGPRPATGEPASPALAIATSIAVAQGPDLLVYYAPTSAPDTSRLPEDARYLGPHNRHPHSLAALIEPVATGPGTIIEPVATGPGTIVVWSGPHQRIVMATKITDER